MKVFLTTVFGLLICGNAYSAEFMTCTTPSKYKMTIEVEGDVLTTVSVKLEAHWPAPLSLAQEIWTDEWNDKLQRGVIMQIFPSEDGRIGDTWMKTALLTLRRNEDLTWDGWLTDADGSATRLQTCTVTQ